MQDTATPPHECTPTPDQLVAWSVKGLVKMHPAQLPRRKHWVRVVDRISRSWRSNVHLMSTSDKYRGNSHRNVVLFVAGSHTNQEACALVPPLAICYVNSALRWLSRNHRSGGFLFGMGTIEQGSLSHTGPNSH